MFRPAVRPAAIAHRLSHVALPALVAVLAACNDGPSAPAAAPDRPSALIDGGDGPVVGPVTVTLRVENLFFKDAPSAYEEATFEGVEVVGSTARFRTDKGYTKDVLDNSAADADKRVGYFSVQMPAAKTITASMRTVPSPWTTRDAVVRTRYVDSELLAFGTIQVNRMNGLVGYLKDELLKLLPGGTVTVHYPNGTKVTINGDPAVAAKLPRVYLPTINETYVVCVTTPPAGYVPVKTCYDLKTDTWNGTWHVTWTHKAL